MENKIKNAFDEISVDEEYKTNVYDRVLEQREMQAEKNEQKPRRTRRLLRPLGLVAAAIIAVLFIAGFQLYNSETAYISLDINPSLSISINRFDRVIDAQAYNAEAQNILNQVSVNNMEYKQAVEALLKSDGMRPFLDKQSTMWFAVQAESQATEQQMQQYLERSIQAEKNGSENVQAVCHGVSKKVRVDAQKEGMTAGKYQALLDLKELDPDTDIKKQSRHSMHEIQSEIRGHHRHGHGRMQDEREQSAAGSKVDEKSRAAIKDSQGDRGQTSASGHSARHSSRRSGHAGNRQESYRTQTPKGAAHPQTTAPKRPHSQRQQGTTPPQPEQAQNNRGRGKADGGQTSGGAGHASGSQGGGRGSHAGQGGQGNHSSKGQGAYENQGKHASKEQSGGAGNREHGQGRQHGHGE